MCGKIIVELGYLDEIYQRGIAKGLDGLNL
jgi:hypothetical protein